jgi:hypothetical protein
LAQNTKDSGLPILVTPQLARGQSIGIVLNILVPETAADAQQRPFIVRAASKFDSRIFKVANGALTIVAAALVGSSTISRESAPPGETFTQTITVRNQGSAPARTARADFIFNQNFEFVSANPAPLVYDNGSRSAIWNLGDMDARTSRDISVILRIVPDALAAAHPSGRGTLRTSSLPTEASFDGPTIEVGRVPKAQIEARSTRLTATPGNTVFIPFVVHNPSNYAESFNLKVAAPGAPQGTLFADTNGDGRYQASEPAVSQTTALEPLTGQFPLLLRVEIPSSTPDRMQFAYSVVARPHSAERVASEANTVLTVEATGARVNPTANTGTPAATNPTPARPTLVIKDGDTPPNIEQAAFNKGQMLYNQRHYEQAAAAFDDLLKTYPNSVITDLTLMWLGRSYISLGRIKDAEQIGLRLRAIKDTPFDDIFDNELKATTVHTGTGDEKPPAPLSPKHIRMDSSDAPSGANVTITSDVALNDYSAYRSGDRYYVVIPQAKAKGSGGIKGRGFEGVAVQQRGQDVVISFKLQPGASARVDLKFNRLVISFDAKNINP